MTRLHILGTLAPATTISRVFSARRLFQVLRERRIGLVPPSAWDDPFENFLLRSRVRLPFGTWASFRWLHDSYFGQCWTLLSESDALWRIYSAKRDGILVRTTVRRFSSHLRRRSQAANADAFFLGKVAYVPADSIRRKFLSSRWRDEVFDAGSVAQARTLFIKRREFAHEGEVRVLAFRAPSSDGDRAPFVHVDVDPVRMFTEAVLDPRISSRAAKGLAARLRAAGFAGAIRQSMLYRPPSLEYRVTI